MPRKELRNLAPGSDAAVTDPHWIAWVVVIPLLGGMVAYALARRAAVVTLVVALGTSFAAVAVVRQVATRGSFRYAVGDWGAPLGIVLRADGIAALMLAVVAVVGVALTAYAWIHFRASAEAPHSFFALWCLTWGALNALVLSNDVFNLYVVLELTTLGAVALLGGSGQRAASAAALHYLLIAIAGSLAYLSGVVVLYGSQSALDVDLLAAQMAFSPAVAIALSLMAVGLALKSALFPFHAWLPPAYASATAPVAVVLSALVGKSAFYVLLRVWFDVFPAITAVAPGRLLGALGSAGVLWGSMLALRQRRLTMLLAYSSVAQIGYFFLVFPLGTTAALQGGLYLVASHAVAKAAMFMAVGTIQRTFGDDDLARMQGLAERLPLTALALALGGMSLIGLPPTGGFVGKWLLTRASFAAGQWWWALIALAGGLLSAGYVFRMLRGVLLPPTQGDLPTTVLRSAEWVALTLALLAVALGLMPWPVAFLLEIRSGL
jgi:multicomponent Na+:H+ antiporter subunit D